MDGVFDVVVLVGGWLERKWVLKAGVGVGDWGVFVMGLRTDSS